MTSYFEKHKWPISILIMALGAAWIWFSRPQEAAKPIYAPQEGFLPPDFSLASLSGDGFSLSDAENKPLILNFWASWCPPCRTEMPAFEKIYQEYENSGLMVAAINASSQDSIADVAAFVETNQLTYPILLDISGSATRAYNIHSLPTTFFITADGQINKIIIGGPLPLSLLRIETARLLGNP